jgi:hypothetical protein
MSLTRRAFAGLAAGALVAPALAHAADPLPLVMEEFFVGRLKGTGRFTSPLFGTDRAFTLDAVGRIEGGDLILVERIVYEDGVRDTAVWRFTPTGSGYAGRRTGVDGVVPVFVRDGAVSMGYVAEVPGTDGNLVRLRFDDVLERTDARTVLNIARVSYLGIPVGTVEVVFTR